MARGREPAWRFFQSGSVLLVLGLFLFSLGGFDLGGVLSPFVLFWVLVMVLLPFRGGPGYTAMLVLAVLLTLFIAVVSGHVLLSLLKVSVVYGISQGLEGGVISPRIVGDSVGLHPVWVVPALAVGGFYFGFVCLLIGVPAAVGVKLLVVRGVHRYRQSDLFLGAS